MAGAEHIIWFWYAPDDPVADESPVFTSSCVVDAFGAADAMLLGRGSFGETWKLMYDDGRESAVKIIIDPDYPIQRIDREIEGLRRGRCRWVVGLEEVGRVSIEGAERVFMRFEFVLGGDAAGHVRADHWPTSDELAQFADGVLRGLAALHANDTVHRDLKLENVALRDGDWARPVLLDLGLARILDGASVTAYPTLLGTRPYMAPEQLRGERARKATDLWALGVMMHILSSRAHPFYGSYEHRLELADALRKITSHQPAPLPLAEPLPALAGKWLSPVQHRRGTARSAIAELGLEEGEGSRE